jgi:DNA polymerase-3 subunit gamma/tau
MPAQALYLKYRPRTFGQVEGQEHVTRTLRNALALGRTTHAYLFTGPRGTGKTTIARLLAKAVNCLAESGDRPCNACAVCVAINEERMLDLIEIDAASNTSVDDIRDLRDKVDYRPGEARYKVYIVDEVHMLSTAAFNALLKTLEEPPPHVIFILATTDPQKIPATVLSRVQRFDFRRLTIAEITERLGEIAASENLRIEPAALDLVARQATGALRDAISLLDQLISYGGDEITLAQVQGLLGAGSHQAIGDLVRRLALQDVAGSLSIVTRAVDGGADPRQLAREIVEYLRGLLLIRAGNGDALTMTADAQAEMKEQAAQFKTDQLLRAIRLFNQAAYEMRASANPTLPLELAIVESLLEQERAVGVGETATRTTPIRQDVDTAKPSGVSETAPNRPAPPRRAPAKPNTPASSPTKEEPAEPVGPLSLEILKENWDRVLARVRVYNKVVEALLRGAEPIEVSEDVVTLGFYYQQHAERFEKLPDGKAPIEKALLEVLHHKCRVKCVLSPRRAKLKAVEQDPLIQAAVSQMGAEITEIHEEE